MRNTFLQELLRQAEMNPRIFLVVGDLGFSVVEPFAERFPERFLNAGVAEQNMTSLAAGLASEGYHVFTYSIANFPTLRCLEQIRNDVCYHNLPVTITSVGAGVAYGNLGYSHHAVQDIAVMRTLPHLRVYSPADPGETRGCLSLLLRQPGPSYLRLGKAGDNELHQRELCGAGPIQVRAAEGPLAFVATGSILKHALAAAELLAQRGVQAAVYSCPVLSPEQPEVFAPLWRHRNLVSVEEHGQAGGWGSFLKEIAPDGVRIRICALADAAASLVGTQQFLRKHGGLEPESLVRAAETLVHQTR